VFLLVQAAVPQAQEPTPQLGLAQDHFTMLLPLVEDQELLLVVTQQLPSMV
jgi:hypothetical protein